MRALSSKSKAFTLIEVMVVLSILAIIAILAYNFFGSTMKEAKTKQLATEINRELQSLSTAWHMSRQFDDVTVDNYPTQGYDALISSGRLKSKLGVPDACQTDPVNYNDYVVGSWTDYGGPSAANDYALLVSKVTEDCCLAFNENFSRLGNSYINYTGDTAPLLAQAEIDNAFCYHIQSNGANIIIQILERI